MSCPELPEGWAKPSRERVYHYFRNGIALCGQAYFTGPTYPEAVAQPSLIDCEDCTARVLARAQAKEDAA